MIYYPPQILFLLRARQLRSRSSIFFPFTVHRATLLLSSPLVPSRPVPRLLSSDRLSLRSPSLFRAISQSDWLPPLLSACQHFYTFIRSSPGSLLFPRRIRTVTIRSWRTSTCGSLSRCRRFSCHLTVYCSLETAAIFNAPNRPKMDRRITRFIFVLRWPLIRISCRETETLCDLRIKKKLCNIFYKMTQKIDLNFLVVYLSFSHGTLSWHFNDRVIPKSISYLNFKSRFQIWERKMERSLSI